MTESEIKERERIESQDEIQVAIPPEDIVAFNESRSCADLFRLYDKQQLDIRPKFQRGIVWTDKEQALFVDSLMKQLPIPSLCISVDAKTQKRLVIDGLQRMWTIIHFLNYEKEDWKLPKTAEIDQEISGKKVSEIQKNSPTLFDKLENLTIPITVLRCNYDKPSHMDYLFQIFRRLNSGGRKLLNQEIRNCIYSGNFNDFLTSFVREKEWLSFAKVSIKDVDNARFGNEERILRFFGMLYKLDKYNSNLAQFLNDYMGEVRNLSQANISKYRTILSRTIAVASRLNISADIHKNKNLVEAILVGIALNISNVEKMSDQQLLERYHNLLQTAPFTEEKREGVARKEKVLERIDASSNAWRD